MSSGVFSGPACCLCFDGIDAETAWSCPECGTRWDVCQECGRTDAWCPSCSGGAYTSRDGTRPDRTKSLEES